MNLSNKYLLLACAISAAGTVFGAQTTKDRLAAQYAMQKDNEKQFFAAAKAGDFNTLVQRASNIKDPANCQEAGTKKTALMYLAVADNFDGFCDWLQKYRTTMNLSLPDSKGQDIRKIIEENDHSYLTAIGALSAYGITQQKVADESKDNLENQLDYEAQRAHTQNKSILKSATKKYKNAKKNKQIPQRIEPSTASSKVSRLATMPTISETTLLAKSTAANTVLVDALEQQQAEDARMKDTFFKGATHADIHEMQYALKHSRLHPNSTDSNGHNALVHVLREGIAQAQKNKWSTVNDRYAALGWLLGQGTPCYLDDNTYPVHPEYVIHLARKYTQLLRNEHILRIFVPYIKDPAQAKAIRDEMARIRHAKNLRRAQQRLNSKTVAITTESPLMNNNQTNNAKTKK